MPASTSVRRVSFMASSLDYFMDDSIHLFEHIAHRPLWPIPALAAMIEPEQATKLNAECADAMVGAVERCVAVALGGCATEIGPSRIRTEGALGRGRTSFRRATGRICWHSCAPISTIRRMSAARQYRNRSSNISGRAIATSRAFAITRATATGNMSDQKTVRRSTWRASSTASSTRRRTCASSARRWRFVPFPELERLTR